MPLSRLLLVKMDLIWASYSELLVFSWSWFTCRGLLRRWLWSIKSMKDGNRLSMLDCFLLPTWVSSCKAWSFLISIESVKCFTIGSIDQFWLSWLGNGKEIELWEECFGMLRHPTTSKRLWCTLTGRSFTLPLSAYFVPGLPSNHRIS